MRTRKPALRCRKAGFTARPRVQCKEDRNTVFCATFTPFFKVPVIDMIKSVLDAGPSSIFCLRGRIIGDFLGVDFKLPNDAAELIIAEAELFGGCFLAAACDR